MKLWFDVGIKRYTTSTDTIVVRPLLWFDVGIKRYTTRATEGAQRECCGLM